MFDGCICAIQFFELLHFMADPNTRFANYEVEKWALLVISNATFYPLSFLCITFEDEMVFIWSTVLKNIPHLRPDGIKDMQSDLRPNGKNI